MSKIIYQKLLEAKEQASKTLSSQRIMKIPIPIKKIANNFGINILEIDLSDEISGLLKISKNTGKPVIVVNKNHSKNRKRFTIAHELGHYLLHGIRDIHVDSSKIYFRDNESSTATKIQEMQANKFAANLLIPDNFIINDLKKFRNDLLHNDTSSIISKLAEKYAVSQQAITIRIGNIII